MKIVSKYKFRATLHSYKGWGTGDFDAEDEIQQIINKNKTKYVTVDVYDVTAVTEREIGGEKVIELLLNNGSIVILCEERVNDIIDFWISATETYTEESHEPKTET